MPLYDYKCNCGNGAQDVFAKMDEVVPCPACGQPMVRQVCAPAGYVFRAGYFEHITPEPVYCGSKADLRAVCRDHNCTSDYAE